jgi:hypothetical protein
MNAVGRSCLGKQSSVIMDFTLSNKPSGKVYLELLDLMALIANRFLLVIRPDVEVNLHCQLLPSFFLSYREPN